MMQDWFEMKDFRRKKMATSVWIPLRAIDEIEKYSRSGFEGYKVEFFGAGSLVIPVDKKEKAEKKLGWMDIGISHNHHGSVKNGKYIPTDIYEDYSGEWTGVHPVLVQRFNRNEIDEWHVHQDFVITLGLKREGDVWVSTTEGYMEVVRLWRHEDRRPYLLEVRLEHLKDYLCARQMALYVTSYRSREMILANASSIGWSETSLSDTSHEDHWEGRVLEIHEGGFEFGAEVGVFHAPRTDVDAKEDVPTFDLENQEAVDSKSCRNKFQGRKLYRIQGELWRNEWIDPASESPRIRRDEYPGRVFFTTDAVGNKESKETLQKNGRWLWFRHNVIMTLAHHRGGALSWYTRDTGSVTCSPDFDIHFGINQLGYINVYAKDITLLPEWQQRIWAGYNIGPDGGVSEELLDSQMRAKPAKTQAPEEHLPKAIGLLNKLSEEKLGFSLFKKHDYVPKLLEHSHRFRAVDKAGLYALAKDLARLTADYLNTAEIQTIARPPKDKKWGSLKSLENLFAKNIEPHIARTLLSPLVGVNELRHADAHLPSSKVDEALELVRVDQSLPIVFQGCQLIDACVSGLYKIASELKKWK